MDKLNTKQFLDSYTNELVASFPSLYEYALYTSGGDFGLFDDSEILYQALTKNQKEDESSIWK